MRELLVAEEHSQIYDLWRRRAERGLRLVHVDFHCDMRGLLIDRRRGRAFRIDAGDSRMRDVDSGNFLAHAVAEGIVSSVRWIHDRHGGRRYDVGTVKYESDLTALPHRILLRLRGAAGVPLEFEEIPLDAWDGVRPGERLDIDWDGIASVRYDLATVSRLSAGILDRIGSTLPDATYLVYSPGYSRDDRPRFEEFIERLRGRLGSEVTRIPPPLAAARSREPTLRRILTGIERTAVLGLRRIGIY